MRRGREPNDNDNFLPEIQQPSALAAQKNTLLVPKEVSLPRVGSRAELAQPPKHFDNLLSRNPGLADRNRGAKSTMQIKQKPLAYGQMYKPNQPRDYKEIVLKTKLNDDSSDEEEGYPTNPSQLQAYEDLSSVENPFKP